jgi:hypothetical protein
MGRSDAGVGGSSSAGSGGMAGNGMAGNAGSSSGMPDGAVSFASDIWPILTANCATISCHGDGSFLPQHASSDVNKAYMEAQPVADRIIGRVSGALTPIMPQFCGPAPGFGSCLSLANVALIRQWVEQGAPP